MAIDERAEQPEAKATVEIPPPPPWAIKLAEAQQAAIAETRERFDEQDVTLRSQGAKLDKVITEGIEANVRMTRFEVRLEDLEGSKAKYSGGIKSLSVSDEGQNMQLASLAVQVGELSETAKDLTKKADLHAASQVAQTAMLQKLVGVLDTPLAKKIGVAFGGLVLAALLSATGYLARGNVAAPQPTIIQVAPAAAITDGGIAR